MQIKIISAVYLLLAAAHVLAQPDVPAIAPANAASQAAPGNTPRLVVIDKPVLKPVTTPATSDKTAKPAPVKSLDEQQPAVAVLNLPIAAPVTRKPAVVAVAPSVVAPAPTKVTPQAQEMPGLGVMPGSGVDYQIKSVRVGTDRNELIYVSMNQLNKIVTPFETPQVIDTSGAMIKAVGQDVFVQPADDKPLTIYLSDNGAGQSIGVILVPKVNIPAQSIVLVPDRPSVAGAAPSANAPEMVAPDYTGRLIGVFKQLALGRLPQGFSKSRLPRSIANDGKVIYEPQFKYSGNVFDVYAYAIKSAATEPIDLNEESFYSNSVRAVAFFPNSVLQTGESTTAFIVVDREVKAGVAQ